MPSSTALVSIEQSLSQWAEQLPDALVREAELLPLRRDAVTLLEYVRDQRVVGTQSTGNMPLKAVREVASRFVDPPVLEQTVGDKTYRIRSEQDLWPLYFLRTLAQIGGLVQAGRVRRWRVTPAGTRFLAFPPPLQPAFLLAVWWYRIDWRFAFPYHGLGERSLEGLGDITLARLRSLPVATDIPFKPFADELIASARLKWSAANPMYATVFLRGAVARMVVSVLEKFGALESRYSQLTEERRSGELEAFRITPWGAALLDAMAILAD